MTPKYLSISNTYIMLSIANRSEDITILKSVFLKTFMNKNVDGVFEIAFIRNFFTI